MVASTARMTTATMSSSVVNPIGRRVAPCGDQAGWHSAGTYLEGVDLPRRHEVERSRRWYGVDQVVRYPVTLLTVGVPR